MLVRQSDAQMALVKDELWVMAKVQQLVLAWV